ncbi:ABC transporter ATP-binding protein [Prochlorococcus marinus XMU1402]|uniref:ABC transporter ATP-binding protein n=1 Tax=Prochlorococcus marinus TaxID=1219 RepID=UPI001ADB47E0|nr:ABC transporter ATP-binding protein [Prochlorococcus marinus]MBO8232393.1 ABC transporter ATP-binding protein [Prochlorococcus marinus XMU1402]
MLLSSICEIFSIILIFPLIQSLANPKSIFNNIKLNFLLDFFNIEDQRSLITFITLSFCIVVTFSGIVRLFTLWSNTNFAARIGNDIGILAFKKVLYQDYKTHIQQSSNRVITNLTTEIQRCVQVITYLLQLWTSILIALGVVIGLLIINWRISTFVVLLFLSIYLVVAKSQKGQLLKLSRIISESSGLLLKSVQTGIGAFRDITFDNSQNYFIEDYRKFGFEFRKTLAKSQFLQVFPKYLIDSLSLNFIAIISFFLAISNDGTYVITIIGSAALGFQKLIPALQQVYSAYAGIMSNSSAIKIIYLLLNENQSKPYKISDKNPEKALALFDEVKLCNIYFKYPNNKMYILENINMNIKAGNMVGILGASGSGKSTLVDILSGLVQPCLGELIIDGNKADIENKDIFKQWRKNIAYVPQSIFIADVSLAENIAFGIPKKNIDSTKLLYAIRKSKLENLSLKDSEIYTKKLGEGGINLSGGQRQRIGIARAIYKECPIMIFDEATNALDNKTENYLLEKISSFKNKKTIIIISHSLSTMKFCDKIFKLENKKVNDVSDRFKKFFND